MHIDIIEKSCDRLMNLTNDLIDISKIEQVLINILLKNVSVDRILNAIKYTQTGEIIFGCFLKDEEFLVFLLVIQELESLKMRRILFLKDFVRLKFDYVRI